jgi:putative endonuclease
MSFFAYVIKNSNTGKIYIGQTSNLKNRIDRHNGLLKNKLSSFTSKNKQNGLWILIYFEELSDRKAAIKREKELKSYRGREFIKKFSR